MKPDDDKISVSGWAVSDDPKANLQVLMDGQIVNSVINRASRPDIDKLISPSFGGTSVNPKPGFQTIIDISQYSAGQHVLKLREISQNNELLSESEVIIIIENKKYIGRIFIDNPKENQEYTRPDNSSLLIQGWAVANDTDAKLQIFIDGNIVNSNIQRFVREDVNNLIANQFGGVKETPKAGYQADIDISNYSKGQHTLKIKELSRNSELLAESEIVFFINNKKYDGNMFIDFPQDNQKYVRPDNKNIIISGWAVSNDTNDYLNILIDERKCNSRIKRFLREDVDRLISPKYGGSVLTPNAGFQASVDISNLNKGVHTIKVQEFSRYGDLIFETAKIINIENKKYSRRYVD